MLNSDLLLVFLAIMREGSSVGAARRLGLDHSTVSRRLSALERELGARLFDRSPRGLAPTEAAAVFLPHAELVENELILAAGAIGQRDARVSGTVRLATPEMFGTNFLAPYTGELIAAHPDLLLELVPETRSTSLSKREADIAISLRRPPRGRLVARRLLDYRLGLYAAPAYVERHGLPSSRADLARHLFVSFVEELIDFPELLALDQARLDGRVVFRSSSSTAQHAAVAAGVGIGMLHGFAARQDPRLVPVLLREVEIWRSYWLVLHADLQRVPRIRAVVDFLTGLVKRRQREF